MKLVKRIFTVGFALSLSLLSACNKGAAPVENAPAVAENSAPAPAAAPAAPAENSEPQYSIAFCMNALDEFQTEQLAFYEAECEKRGIGFSMTNADGSPDKHIADFETAIMNEPDLIYTVPVDQEAITPAIQAAADAGIPVISIADVSEAAAPHTFQLIADQYTAGIQVNYWLDEYMTANPEATLKVGYIWGMMGMTTLNDRNQAFIDGLVNKYEGRVELLAEKAANWSSTEAMALTEDWMQAYPEMNCIVSQSDEMSVGAVNALKAGNTDFDNFYIVSFDGSPNGQTHIREGSMKGTVFYAKKVVATLMLDYAERIMGGETELVGTKYDMGSEVLFPMTLDNIDELLEKYSQ